MTGTEIQGFSHLLQQGKKLVKDRAKAVLHNLGMKPGLKLKAEDTDAEKLDCDFVIGLASYASQMMMMFAVGQVAQQNDTQQLP